MQQDGPTDYISYLCVISHHAPAGHPYADGIIDQFQTSTVLSVHLEVDVHFESRTASEQKFAMTSKWQETKRKKKDKHTKQNPVQYHQTKPKLRELDAFLNRIGINYSLHIHGGLHSWRFCQQALGVCPSTLEQLVMIKSQA